MSSGLSGSALRGPTALRSLRRLREARREGDAGERCEMCAAEIAETHSHVVNVESRSLLCSCRACYLLFTQQGAAQGKFRSVPERFVFIPDFRLDAGRWEAFEIPVRVAFFFRNSALGRIAAFYPSPAGATESQLSLEAWQALEDENPILREIEPDVEALLVYGAARSDGFECLLVPIDACYELTGIVRSTWRGFEGGDEAHAAIGAFFERLRVRSIEKPTGGAR